MIKKFRIFCESAEDTADIIYKYLGGNKFKAMVGATLIKTNNGLDVRFKGSKFANSLSIKLNSMDTFDLTFAKISGLDYKIVKTIEGVWGEDLQDIFTEYTKLYTSL